MSENQVSSAMQPKLELAIFMQKKNMLFNRMKFV